MPWKSQEKIHQVMNHLFDNTPYGICGNEDCGQMSAWYIFSSMGFYPVCPGTGEYVLGTPALEEVNINLENGKSFRITTRGLSEDNFYIREVTLNGKPLECSFITHEDIIAGGELIYVMGPRPNKKWASRPEQAPYSMSK
jgi:predicted alpha-1,2-mannosidase